jgi:hypothetical protein
MPPVAAFGTVLTFVLTPFGVRSPWGCGMGV